MVALHPVARRLARPLATVAGACAALPPAGAADLGPVPSLDGAVAWLNSPPLRPGQLRGKVVLIDFWTYSCINCIRTLPYLRAWADKYRGQGLVVIGVHTPEFEFGKDPANVARAVRHFGIGYPVAVDSEQRIWNAFHNNAWPVFYLVDARGRLRARLVGEGDYGMTERMLRSLLAEAGRRGAAGRPTTPKAAAEQAAPDVAHLRSSETYIGNALGENAGGAGSVRDASHDYPRRDVGLNEWNLVGRWTVGAEHATLDWAGGGIVYRFSARDLHLVLGPKAGAKPVRFQVRIDGRAPGPDHGADVDAEGNGVVTATRLYQLVRQAGPVRERLFEIRFIDPDVHAFSFSFG